MIQFLLCIALLAPSPSSDNWFWDLQREDGPWDADRFPEELEGAVPGAPEDDVAVTSLLALACLGDGHTSSRGLYQDRVASALHWLAGQQTDDGRIGREEHARALHHHALAILALSENLYFEGKPDHSAQVQRGVEALEKAALAGGGWSASGKAEGPADPVTTTWAAMALCSARDAKLVESSVSTEKALEWFRRHRAPDTGLFRASESQEADFKATLCALATRLFAGESPKTSPDFGPALDAIIDARPELRADPEYYYLTSVVAYKMGGSRWKRWNKITKQTVLDLGRGGERKDGLRSPLLQDPEAPVCGSLGASAFAVLNLEVYFRNAKLVGLR